MRVLVPLVVQHLVGTDDDYHPARLRVKTTGIASISTARSFVRLICIMYLVHCLKRSWTVRLAFQEGAQDIQKELKVDKQRR